MLVVNVKYLKNHDVLKGVTEYKVNGEEKYLVVESLPNVLLQDKEVVRLNVKITQGNLFHAVSRKNLNPDTLVVKVKYLKDLVVLRGRTRSKGKALRDLEMLTYCSIKNYTRKNRRKVRY